MARTGRLRATGGAAWSIAWAALAGCATGDERARTPENAPPVTVTPLAPVVALRDASVESAGAAPAATTAPIATADDGTDDESEYVACGGAPKIDPKVRLGDARARAGGLMDPTMGAPGFGFYRVARAPSVAPGAPIRIALTGPARVKAGAPLGLVATVENTTSAPLVIGLAVDGSLEHWRSPYVDLYAKDEASGAVYRWDYHGGRCGNVNARTPKDFVTLAPGAKHKPAFGEWASHVHEATIDTPGRYTVWVVYTSCSGKDTGIPLGASPRLPMPWHGIAASAPVTIDVQP